MHLYSLLIGFSSHSCDFNKIKEICCPVYDGESVQLRQVLTFKRSNV